MSIASFIRKKFIGQEICVNIEEEAEMLTFSEIWVSNKEFFKGIAKSVEEGVLELEVPEVGIVWINCDSIKMIWLPPFNWRKAIHTSLTQKPIKKF